jgi:hypothetical protein
VEALHLGGRRFKSSERTIDTSLPPNRNSTVSCRDSELSRPLDASAAQPPGIGDDGAGAAIDKATALLKM